MSLFLGIDTSNYTTSTAIYDSKAGEMVQQKKLLPRKEGQLGLRRVTLCFTTQHSRTRLLKNF